MGGNGRGLSCCCLSCFFVLLYNKITAAATDAINIQKQVHVHAMRSLVMIAKVSGDELLVIMIQFFGFIIVCDGGVRSCWKLNSAAGGTALILHGALIAVLLAGSCFCRWNYERK